jgi:branched-chain amino acid transport system ATP-binding protein
VLEVEGLCVDYGGVHALREVSLEVAEGSIVALIGPNGAGKTTLLNAICGTVRPARGRVLFGGEDIVGVAAYKVARRGLLHVPEGRQILGPLSVAENLDLGRLALGDRATGGGDDLERVFSLFPLLKQRSEQEGGSLSGGEQQMLAIGRALMGRPRVLLLDEPSLGLSPLITNQVFAALQLLNKDGLTILLVEQNARRALDITQRAYVLEQGRVVQSGRSADLASDASIIEHYLGRQAVAPKPVLEVASNSDHTFKEERP